jgi:hypothetical protein
LGGDFAVRKRNINYSMKEKLTELSVGGGGVRNDLKFSALVIRSMSVLLINITKSGQGAGWG